MLRSSKIFVEKMKGENEATSWRHHSKRILFANYKVPLNFRQISKIFSIKKRMPFWTPSFLNKLNNQMLLHSGSKHSMG